jgi:hypothetical protein
LPRGILSAWKSSAHAQAVESPLIQDALDVAETRFGTAARRTCLKWRAPVAAEKGDLNLSQKVSWEGVTLRLLLLDQGCFANRLEPQSGDRVFDDKSGPLKDAESSAHGAEYSVPGNCTLFM